MAEAKVSGPLALPPEQAWQLMSDLSRFGEWMTIHDAWASDIPELTVGAKVTQRLSIMGMANVVEWTIDEYAPPSSLRISGMGMAGAQIAFTLAVDPAQAGSTVCVSAEFTGQIMTGAIGAAVEQHATVELENSLAKLRQLAG